MYLPTPPPALSPAPRDSFITPPPLSGQARYDLYAANTSSGGLPPDLCRAPGRAVANGNFRPISPVFDNLQLAQPELMSGSEELRVSPNFKIVGESVFGGA